MIFLNSKVPNYSSPAKTPAFRPMQAHAMELTTHNFEIPVIIIPL
jgi:hypothetical protein